MFDASGGCIVNVSSISASAPPAVEAIYGAANCCLDALAACRRAAGAAGVGVQRG